MAIRKSFLNQNLGAWHPLSRQKRVICETFSAKIVFFTNSQKFFSLKSFPLYGIGFVSALMCKFCGQNFEPKYNMKGGWVWQWVARGDIQQTRTPDRTAFALRAHAGLCGECSFIICFIKNYTYRHRVCHPQQSGAAPERHVLYLAGEYNGFFFFFNTRNTTPTTPPAIRSSPSKTPITAPAIAPPLPSGGENGGLNCHSLKNYG